MKKVVFLFSLGVFLMVSCAKNEQKPEQDAQVSDVSFTPCQQTKATKSVNSDKDKVDVVFTNEGVKITHSNFEVTCDFTTVNVTHTFVNGVLRITQKGSPNEAKCICFTDVSYTIRGISQKEVNVIFINGEQVYCHNDKDDDNDNSGVYVALYEIPDYGIPTVPKLWKDGKLTNLINDTDYAYALSVYVSDHDVYVAGHKYSYVFVGDMCYVVPYALLWKNGKVQTIGSDYSQTVSVFVSDNDVYVAGQEYLIQNSGTLKNTGFVPCVPTFVYEYQLPETIAISTKSSSIDASRQGVAALWKNGTVQYLTDGSNLACAMSVYVSGNDVYVAGWERKNQDGWVAKLWKNGIVQNLTDGRYYSEARSVYVSGNDVYVAGFEGNASGLVATLWKNGTAFRLSDGQSANSVFVSGNDVYVAGYGGKVSNWVPKLWKNGVEQYLTVDRSESTQARSVYISGNDVYVVGFSDLLGQNNPRSVVKLWKNGVVQDLTDGSKHGFAYSVFVK